MIDGQRKIMGIINEVLGMRFTVMQTVIFLFGKGLVLQRALLELVKQYEVYSIES